MVIIKNRVFISIPRYFAEEALPEPLFFQAFQAVFAPLAAPLTKPFQPPFLPNKACFARFAIFPKEWELIVNALIPTPPVNDETRVGI